MVWFVLFFPNVSYCGVYPKGHYCWPLEQHSPKPHDCGPEPPTISNDVHNRCWLFFYHFGSYVAFAAEPQKVPFLWWPTEFPRGLGLLVHGLGRLRTGSVILGLLRVASSLRMKMGLDIRVVTYMMWVPSASANGQAGGGRWAERKISLKPEKNKSYPWHNHSCMLEP